MSTVIVLMEKDHTFKVPFAKAIKVFSDWDMASLICADKNFESTDKTYYYLQEVPFDQDLECVDVDISHSGPEIKISFGEDNEVYAEVELEPDTYEDYFNENCPPNILPTYNVKSVTLCGTEVDNLKISDDLKRKIQHEAENYRDEMIEEIGEPQDDD
jgi:hypothetical protein